jgi:hypothetical protein
MKSMGVGVIVNLLSVYDLRTIGVSLDEYQSICQEHNIELITFPIQSMKGPDQNAQKFDKELIGSQFLIYAKKLRTSERQD